MQAAQPWTATRSSQTPQTIPTVCWSENNRVSHKQGVLGWGCGWACTCAQQTRAYIRESTRHVVRTATHAAGRVTLLDCICLVKVLVSVAAKLVSGVPVSAICVKSCCNARVAISNPCPACPARTPALCVSVGQGQAALVQTDPTLARDGWAVTHAVLPA